MPRTQRHTTVLVAALASVAINVQASNLKASTPTSTSKSASASGYDLMHVYNLALENDAQAASAKSGMQAAMEKVPQTRGRLLPNLTLNANTQYNKVVTGIDGSDDIKDDYNSHGWSATLTQPLFNLGSWFSYKQAQSLSTQAKHQFAYEQQNLILRVAEAYFNVLRGEDSLVTALAEEKAVKQQLDQARERYKVGLIAETDVLEAQAAYDNARVFRILADNTVSVNYESLRTITNETIDNIGKLKKNMPVLAPTPNNIDDWIKNSVASNLALKTAQDGVKAAEEGVKTNKSGHAPTLDVFARYSYSSSDSDSATQIISTNPTTSYTGRNNQSVVGLNLTVPLFAGGATSSQAREATYRMEQSQHNFDKLLRETMSNTRSYFKTVNVDVERVQARKQGIVSSKSALRATQSGYEVGTRNITGVLDAQKTLYAAQRDYLNARYDFIINTLMLKQLAGRLSPADLQDLNRWITFSKSESSASEVK